MIYLDNAATTQIAPEVLDAMMPYLSGQYGNAGAIYALGRQSAGAIAEARLQVANFMGATPDQIIFTSGGTEANNLAIIGCKDYLETIGKTHIVTSMTEHDSVLKAVEALCKPLCHNTQKCIKGEFYASYLPVDADGRVIPTELLQCTMPMNDVGLVSVMYVNNEVGVQNNIQDIGRFCRTSGVIFHTDCVQAAGSLPLNGTEIMCDLMSISSHKIHGPKGVGALYVRNHGVLSALIHGGHAQEYGLRGGTENVAGIVGFGKACELAQHNMAVSERKIIALKETFLGILSERVSSHGNTVHINGLSPQHPGKILSLTFDGIDAETLVLMLDANNVCISAGSACRSHESLPSRVLLAMGMSADEARDTVRVSFSEYNTYSEIEEAAILIADCVQTLRSATV